MNPTAIYSKSGKGVQEAAGKTSLLGRPDRAVLSAIDGRATLADVAQKVGKPFDAGFQQVIRKLDSDGFIREVSAGTAVAAPASRPAAKAPAKPAPKVAEDPASDLDFSMLGGPSRPAPAPAKAGAAPPSRPAAPSSPPKPAASAPKEQESALFKARQEAEAKAQAERDRQRKEAEDRLRAEAEAKLRAEAEAKARAEAEAKHAAEAEAKVKAAREAAMKAAAVAKANAEAEANRAREEAERARKEAEERERKAREEAERLRKEAEERERKAREEAERREAEERIRREAQEKARREAEEKARREAEELRRRLEEERKAREEAERKAREEAERIRREAEAEAERARKELEEERRRLEEERRAREEEDRRDEEERAARRRAREEEEAREAEEREARRRDREEEHARESAAAARAAEKEAAKEAAKQAQPEPAAGPAAAGDGFSDSLMADLASFATREEEEAKERAEAERKAKEERERREREEAERREKEEAAARAKEEKRRAKEEKARKKREEEERLRREDDEEKERIGQEEERRRREAEERERKAKEEEALARRATSSAGAGYVSDDDRRKRALKGGRRDPSLARRQRRSWGRPVAIVLLIVLAAALGAVHVMPVSTTEYERAAAEALGRPVSIGSARLSLVTGLELRFDRVAIGEVKIARVVAHPTIGSLTGERKAFGLIELEGMSLPQQAVGEALFAKVKGDNFAVERIVVRRLELPGELPMPKELEAEASFGGDGTLTSATVRGEQGLVARLEPGDGSIGFQVQAGLFTLPIAPTLTLGQFSMKGAASARGMQISEWDAAALDGTLSGTAKLSWGRTWNVDGVITARGINAAVFAPALLSEGRAEGTGRFSMSGQEPAKLGATGRLEGNFTVSRGVLGSFDLSRAIQTDGRQAQGRTQFAEMSGQAIYDDGAVTLRNVTIGAGALNAGASASISPSGALSGRIVADVRTASQTLRATLNLGGTVKEPQVRN